MAKKVSQKRTTVVQFLIGLALIAAADNMNKAGHINFGTFFIYLVGAICIMLSVIDYFKGE
ncbi:MAG: hypothetical protein ACXWLH_04455 [Candidatus Saccharimonadales bacterium]